MNLFQLIVKQMRQRALSSWLTLLSVCLGVGLAIAVMIVRRESAALMGQSSFGYEFVVGPPKASPTELVLNTVYHLGKSPGNLPYHVWERLDGKAAPKPGEHDYRPDIKWAVPFMVGDSYQGRWIIGTSPQMFGYTDEAKPYPSGGNTFAYGRDAGGEEQRFELTEGTVFRPRRFEAVIGSELATGCNLHVGDEFQATHGMPGPNETPDIHKPKWKVVGILKPTHTPNDRCLFVPVISLYAIEEHEVGMIQQKLLASGFNPNAVPPNQMEAVLRTAGIDPDALENETRLRFHLPAKNKPSPDAAAATAPAEDEPEAYTLDQNGNIVPELPADAWEISAVLIKSRPGIAGSNLAFYFQTIATEFQAANPAIEMRKFFELFLTPATWVLLAISLLVTVVAAISILVSIYNSVAARMREIAILRALGATRRRIVAMICLEAGIIGVLGSVLGLLLAHALAWIGSNITFARLGQHINWSKVGWDEPWYANELVYILLVIAVALLAGLVPALKAYRSPVATNLVA